MSETFEAHADFVDENSTSICIVDPDGQQTWLPKSQLEDIQIDHIKNSVFFIIPVWLADRVTGVTNATDTGGIDIMDGVSTDGGTGGFASTSTVPGVNDKWTIELKPESGATLNIERTLPGRLDTIMDLR